jgi:integrase
MATITRRRGSKVWTAFFRDANKPPRLHCRSTGVTDRKEARRIANEYESVSRKKRTLRQLQRVLSDMHKLVGGEGAVIVTVREHIEAWLSAKSGETSKSTMAFYRGATSRFLTFLGPRADQSLLEISKIDLVNYRNTLAKSVSAVTTDHNMAVVKMVFLSAAQDDLIGDDPSEFLKSMNKEKTIAKRAFTKTEIQAVLSVADPEWRSMVLFGLYTGQRLVDLARLSWNNIDLEHGEIRFVTAKTGRPMTIPMAERLRSHIESLPSSDDPNAFIHERIAQTTGSTLSSQFAVLLVQAGLRSPKVRAKEPTTSRRRNLNELSFHSLRHTAVSLLHDAGIPQATVLEFVGHSSSAMSKRYTHTGIESLRKAADALPEI